MTVTLFVSIITAGAIIAGVLTEAIKQAYKNANKQYSPNVIALIDALVVGGGGTAGLYMLLGIPWTVNNVICLIGVSLVTWIICMVGYDKVVQAAKQLGGLQVVDELNKAEDKN